MATTLVLLSDTHGSHRELVVPAGDILIHAGDATNTGSIAEIAEFGRWLGELPHRHKIFVAGNHDWAFERHPQRARSLLPGEVHYLQDREVTVAGVRIWGSPWQPEFNAWAFNLPRGARLAEKWALIPEGLDVLVTHGPPAGIGDRTVEGEHTGCADLAQIRARLARRESAASPDEGQRDGLHRAAGEGNLGALRALLDLGLDVNPGRGEAGVSSVLGARILGAQGLARLREALLDLSRLAHRRDAAYAEASPQLHREYQALRLFLSYVDLELAAELTLDEIASTIEGPLPESVREKIGSSEPGTLRELRRRLACWLRGGLRAEAAPDEQWIG